MKRPCYCNRALAGVPLDKFDDSVPPEQKQCVACWLALNDPAYRKLWGIATDEEIAANLDAIKQLPVRKCCGQDEEDLKYDG